MDGYKDEILDHNYDGIQEYDNPMPAWWSSIFVITIIWAGIYVAAIELGYIARYEEDLKEGTEEIVAMRRTYEDTQPKLIVDEQMLLAASQDVDQVSQGAEIFAGNCANCHGNQGQGMVGPNLTDDHWIHGVKMTQIHEILVNGVAEAGMPAWASILTPEEIVATTAYVASLHGTDPEGAKGPQGEEYAMGPAEALEQEEAAEGVQTDETNDGSPQDARDAEGGLDEVIQETPGDVAVPDGVKVKPPMEGVGSDVAYPKDGLAGEDPDPGADTP